MRVATESYLLVNPDTKKNSHDVAKRIASCKGVRKVTITSGEVGFVVSTVESGEHKQDRISRTVNRIMGRRKVKLARGHYVYARIL